MPRLLPSNVSITKLKNRKHSHFMFNFLEKLENLPPPPLKKIIRNTQKNNNGNPIVLKSQNKKKTTLFSDNQTKHNQLSVFIPSILSSNVNSYTSSIYIYIYIYYLSSFLSYLITHDYLLHNYTNQLFGENIL